LLAVMLSEGVVAVESAAAQTAPSTSTSTPSTLIRLDGQLTTATGAPRTGPVLLVISLYANQADSTPQWVEQQLVPLDQAGRYTVLAGATQADGVPQQFFLSGAARWIGVGVQGEAEQPRIRLVSIPYALKAREADTLAGKTASDFVLTATLNTTVQSAVTAAAAATTAAATTNILPTTINALAKFSDTAAGVGDSAVVEINGKIGIGTPAPAGRLSVEATGVANVVIGRNTDVGPGSNAMFTMVYTSDTDQAFAFKNIAANGHLWSMGDGIGVNAGYFGVYDQSAAATRLTVDNTGNVGIGTTSPATKLHVVGDVTVTGNIGAKYQDVAEWVETAAPLEPGTVVIVDPLTPNRVLPASRAYDTRVAGAVSRQPGLVLGERSDTKAMIAQSGRVRIKADARYGAIRIGDLLVTSPTPGYAMRSRPMRVGTQAIHRSGTLLGKALEALPSGKGEILVLLTLQ
jgi:hypothetical protein